LVGIKQEAVFIIYTAKTKVALAIFAGKLVTQFEWHKLSR
jgi:hypothetical protein